MTVSSTDPEPKAPEAPETAAALDRAYALVRGILARSSYDLASEDAYDLGLAANALEAATRALAPDTSLPVGASGQPPLLVPEPRCTLDAAAAAVFADEVVRQRHLVRREGKRPLESAGHLQRLWRQFAGMSVDGDGVEDGSMLAAVHAAVATGPRKGDPR